MVLVQCLHFRGTELVSVAYSIRQQVMAESISFSPTVDGCVLSGTR